MDLWPPGRKSIPAAYQATRNLLLAHARAYHAIHSLQPDSRIGLSHQIHPLQPRHPGSPLDRLAARSQSALLNTMIPAALDSGDLRFLGRRTRLPELRGTQDFFGVNYYTREQVSFDLRRPGELFGRRSFPKGADLCDSAFIANDPEGLFQTLRWANRFKLPIIITENGVNDASDRLRPRYLIQHLHQAWRAVNFNFPVKGYFHWTLVDNFEWERGWGQRYGLWELDPRTQTRRKRPSADLYAEICQENGITSEMVQRYAPEISTSLFPD
jgi:beta-glucosidase